LATTALSPTTQATAGTPEAGPSPTDLLDLRQFAQQVAAALADGSAGRTSGLLLVEADRVGQLFRVHGQSALDEAMAGLAKRVAASCGPKDLMCRFGQTRFGVFLPGLDHPGKALFAASAIAGRMTDPVEVQGYRLFINPKIGVAIAPDDATNGQDLIRNAAVALDAVRKSGTATYMHFTRSMRDVLRGRLTLEDELRVAIRDRQFELHYQPKVTLPDGVPVGGEALLRWRHPERGLISPGVFIPTAEDTGLIVQIGEWALREAIRQIRSWLDAGLPPLQISVNVSERQFRWGHLPALIDVLLQESRIPPHLLQLEITETILPNDLDSALKQMRWIADRGVALALDDFGTGYSSLSYLRELPLDCLKVDRKFVTEMETHQPTRHIVEAIVAMARAMDLKVVAEGVERPSQVDLLTRLGVEEAQGYLFARPLPAPAFEAHLRGIAG
jgi:EAL domain-containing protein (putative c-di-GMP-specific phosphodiesterase class I)/GGDEF domain-containing protein